MSEEKQLKSGEVLLNAAQIEYQIEISRITAIDTKISIAMAVVVGALFFILQKWEDMDKLFAAMPDTSSVGAFWLSILIPLAQAVSIGMLILDLFLLVRLIKTKEYQTVDPADFCEVDFLSMEPVDASVALIEYYDEATRLNHKITDNRAKWHNRCLVIMFIAIVLYIVTLFY